MAAPALVWAAAGAIGSAFLLSPRATVPVGAGAAASSARSSSVVELAVPATVFSRSGADGRSVLRALQLASGRVPTARMNRVRARRWDIRFLLWQWKRVPPGAGL